jgi:hypothetical protein
MDVQFDELVRLPFSRARAQSDHRNSIIVIDALDECGDRAARNQLFHVIKTNAETTRRPFRFFITSRPEFPVGSLFQTIPHLHDHLHLHRSREADDDIRRFLVKEFAEIHRKHSDVLSISEGWPSDSDIQSIVNKAPGHFIFASTVPKFVDDDPGNPEYLLDITQDRALAPFGCTRQPYAELDQLYVTILSRVPVPRARNDLLNLLAIYAFAKSGAFHPDSFEIGKALGLRVGDVQLMLRGLRSLIGQVGEWKLYRFFTRVLRRFPHEPRSFWRILHRWEGLSGRC